jgi:hypothetical protein
VHVDRARAEIELLGDLAVGSTDGHETQHLELATCQTRSLKMAGGAASEPLLDPFAELLERSRRQAGYRLGAELVGGAVGVGQSLGRRLPFPGARERRRGPEVGVGALGRKLELA